MQTNTSSINKTNTFDWIRLIGTLVFYITCYIIILYAGFRYAAPLPENVEGNIFKIIWDCLSDADSFIGLCLQVIVFIVLFIKNKKLSKASIIGLSIVFFFQYCFYSVSVQYFMNQAIVALVGILTFIVSAILVFVQPARIVVKKGSIIRDAIGNSIANNKIAGIQIFEYSKKDEPNNVLFTIQALDQLTKPECDVNGMLSGTYRLKTSDYVDFEFITNSYYQTLIESASDETKDDLINLIEKKIANLKERLHGIEHPEDVTKDDCCLARLLVIYSAYLGMLKPPTKGTPTSTDEYIGEHGFRDGDFGVDLPIEKRLFTLVRTGLLGGILVGPYSMYSFQYRKDGYKAGRQYCAFQINIDNANDTKHGYLCLVVLQEISMQSIPAYVIRAIRRLIPKLEKSTNKAIEEVRL